MCWWANSLYHICPFALFASHIVTLSTHNVKNFPLRLVEADYGIVYEGCVNRAVHWLPTCISHVVIIIALLSFSMGQHRTAITHIIFAVCIHRSELIEVLFLRVLSS